MPKRREIPESAAIMRANRRPEPLDLGALASPLLPVLKLIAEGIDAIPFTPEQLVVSLSNSIKVREHELRWRSSFPGKLLLRFRRDKPETIVVDGKRLSHLFRLMDVLPSESIDPGANYEVDLAQLRTIVARAERMIRLTPTMN